jgi:hypothetical protein
MAHTPDQGRTQSAARCASRCHPAVVSVRFDDRLVRASVVVTDLCHQADASSEAGAGSTAGTVAPLAMIITLAIPWVVSQVPSTRSASSAARVSCPGAQEKHGRPPIWILLLFKAAARRVCGRGRRLGGCALGVVMSGRCGREARASSGRERMARSCGAWSHEQETMACPGAVLHVGPRPRVDAGA